MAIALLVDKLLNRLYDRHEKSRVRAYLEAIKKDRDLSNRDAPTSGSLDDLKVTFDELIKAGHLTISQLASHVDSIEENGRQHVFLFDLSDDADVPSIERALEIFQPYPLTVAEEYYDKTPSNLINARTEGSIIKVRQVHTTTYWKPLDQVQDGRIMTIRRQEVDHRAVNILLVDTERRRVELRLSGLGSDDSTKKVSVRLEAFFQQMRPWFDIQVACVPLPVWDAFHSIATDRTETLMHWDEPIGNERYRISARGEDFDEWSDIRDSDDYPRSQTNYARSEVRIYFVRGAAPHREKFEVRLGDLKLHNRKFGKVEFFDVVTAETVTYVLGRVRHFVGALAQ